MSQLEARADALVDPRPHRIIAGLVFLFALVLYFSTIAPTTSFWDCGEFIASSYSMGVPHPPGAPYYLLMGRMFSLLVPVADIGLRVNAFSALVSALTVLFTYLIIVRLVRRWRGPEHTPVDKAVLYGSGVVGALAFAASHSFWWNAVEAEVYAISMFFTAFVVWLAVRWMDEHEHADSSRYLLLISYLVGLATGVHLLNVLALSPIVLLIYFQKYRFTWKGFVIALLASFAAIGVVYPVVVSGVPVLLKAGLIWKILVLAALIGGAVWAIRVRRNLMALILSSILLVLIGYSTYTTIYIRSNLDPEINENQPDTLPRMISYLNREQYGAVGPVELQTISPSRRASLRQQGAVFMPLVGNTVVRFNILERQAPLWDYQINKMYVRYLSWQYFLGEKGQLFVVPFFIGLLGMVWQFWRDPKRGVVVAMLFFMTGLAIVFYLNQPDPQPRERDYAYVGSYFAFALWIGMGVAALFEFLEDLIKDRGPGLRRAVGWGVVGLLVLLIPVNMLARNYESHDRTGNYVAWDYSRNMLESCEQDAIIFTNGDNDTFPLWYLQVVEGLRRDVRVVNLSLLNTDWYIKQLRDKDPQVPISFSDQQVDRLAGRGEESLLLRYWPEGKRDFTVRTPEGEPMGWQVPATMYVPTGMPGEASGEPNFLRVQDVMIMHIVEQNRWRKPIYFAVTVSQSNLIGLDRYLNMEGLVFRLHPGEVSGLATEKMRENLFEVYDGHYRGLNDPDVYFFDNVAKLLQNYRSGFLQLVYHHYRQAAQGGAAAPSGIPEEQWSERFEELTHREKALATLWRMDEVMPPDVVPLTNREVALQVGRIYYDLGDTTSGTRYVESVLNQADNNREARLQAAWYLAEYGGQTERAARIIDEVIEANPSLDALFNAAAVYERAGMKERALEVMERIAARPNLEQRDEIDLASYFLNLGEVQRAVAAYEQLMEKYPASGEVYGGLLQAYKTLGDSQKVRELLDEWLRLHPNDSDAAKMRRDWAAGAGAEQGG